MTYLLRLASTAVWDDIVEELVNEKEGGLDNDACGMHRSCSNYAIYVCNDVLNGCVCIILV